LEVANNEIQTEETMTATIQERPIPEHMADSFRADLVAVAKVNDMTPEAVYALWHKYSRDCSDYDQSAIWSEFLSWYRKQLPNLPQGMTRLG